MPGKSTFYVPILKLDYVLEEINEEYYNRLEISLKIWHVKSILYSRCLNTNFFSNDISEVTSHEFSDDTSFEFGKLMEDIMNIFGIFIALFEENGKSRFT